MWLVGCEQASGPHYTCLSTGLLHDMATDLVLDETPTKEQERVRPVQKPVFT